MSFPKSIWRWAFYDFANSGYILTYASFLLPVFFSTILIKNGYSLGAWGVANAIATVIGVALSVVIGKYSDSKSKFSAFKWSILFSFFGMVAVALSVGYTVGWVYYLFIATQSVFILSLSLSDSILPYLATKEESFEYSGFAWGFGYVGGIIALVLVIIFQKFTGDDYDPLVFLSTAFFYLIFSVYSLRGLKEVKMNEQPLEQKKKLLSTKQKFLLLFGYWLISEGITIILLFFSIFLSKELGFTTLKIGMCLLLVQLIGFPATWYGGYLAKKYDILKLLGLTILFWGIAILFLVVNVGMIGLVLLIIFGALAVGNSQSFLRAQYSNLIDRHESGFQFGIYTIVSEAAVFVGPIIYGFASDWLHSQKIPLIFLFCSMAIGYVLIWNVIKKLRANPNIIFLP
ncbi:MAG: MFS transporter [Candidatus Magasanikbacteria bacterium]